jgi:hypothetical protein
MIDVVFMGVGTSPDIIDNRYRISYFNPIKYMHKKPFSAARFFATTQDIDTMWRTENSDYKKLLNDFYNTYKNVDVIVTTWINPFHPEWLIKMFPETVKIYGCIDDPVSTYTRTAGSIWAFDGAFYVSPGYDDAFLMNELLDNMGVPNYWWPISNGKITAEHLDKIEKSWGNRLSNVLYIGKYYGQKIDRLVKFKQSMNKKFSIYGNWPLHGYAGMLSGMLKLFGIGSCEKYNFFPYRIKTISESEKESLYLKHKICLNMHYSNKRETGNMRMYEAVYYGTMLLCDKAAKDAHEFIYKPDIEAVFYDDIEDALEKANYYTKHDSERENIAKAGFARYCKQYDYNQCLIDFLDWTVSIHVK